MSGAHHHHHHHEHDNSRILAISLAMIAGFMVVEYLGGYFFNSLALMADAGHMANDALSLALALLALKLAHRFARLEQGLALLNGLSLMVIALWIVVEAIERIQAPLVIQSLPMLAVAVVGLLVNMVVARLMLGAQHDNLNIRAAYLHVLADLLGSVVAILSGLSAWLWGWYWVDPVASVLLSVLILRSGGQVVYAAVQALQKSKQGIAEQ